MSNKENKKLEQINRRKAAQACGTFPGMNRARRFTDRKKRANKEACRGRFAE